MKFSEIDTTSKKQEMTHLQEQSMKARMEYENTLLKESLEQSSNQFKVSTELWEKETKKLIMEMATKVNQLQTSNDSVNQNLNNVSENLNKNLEKNLMSVISNANNMQNKLNDSFSAQIRSILNDIENRQLRYMDSLESSQKEFKAFFKRFKYILVGAVGLVVILEIVQTILAIKG